MPAKIIDTHIHCWNFDKADYEWLKTDTSILKRTYNIEEIEEERKNVGVSGGMLVQSANNIQDTNWMLQVAEKKDWIKGVVGWLPLTDPETTFKFFNGKYIANNYFKGVRHLIHNEADPKWLLQEKVLESLKMLAQNNLTYDVVGVLPEHIKTVLKVAEKVPDLRMVFDHLNHPPIKKKEKFGIWGDLMTEASKNKNFFAKISGLGTICNNTYWSQDEVKPYIEFVLKNFSQDRCMLGGDWPVALLAGSYTQTIKTYKSILNSLLGEEEIGKVYHLSAVRFYNLLN